MSAPGKTDTTPKQARISGKLRVKALELASELMGDGHIELGLEAQERIHAALKAAYEMGKKAGES
jgi:hypothetical protein